MIHRPPAELIPVRDLKEIAEGGIIRVMSAISAVRQAGTGLPVSRSDGFKFDWPAHKALDESTRKVVNLGLGGSSPEELHLTRESVLDLFHSGMLVLSPEQRKHNQIINFCGRYGFTQDQLQRTDEFFGYAE